jgi:hypothetical protein
MLPSDHSAVATWLVTLSSAVAAFIAVFSRVAVDPLMAVIVSGFVLVVVAMEILFGYIFEVREMTFPVWGVGMALPTAIGFLIVGLGMITIAFYLRRVVRVMRNRLGLLEDEADYTHTERPMWGSPFAPFRKARLKERADDEGVAKDKERSHDDDAEA